jgi:hypothetical protein
MTSAGIFNLLITDDTRQDSFLIAHKLLSNRMKTIKNKKIQEINAQIDTLNKRIALIQKQINTSSNIEIRNKYKNDIATLQESIEYYKKNSDDLIKPNVNDINESHFLFISNYYKPFVEFAFGYIKSVINTKPLFGNEAEFTIQDYGDFISDMFVHIRISELKAKNPNDRVRYADYLGHRIIKKCQFVISNNVLDEYDRELYNIYYNLHISEAKKKSWLNCMGQELPIEGMLISDPVKDEFHEMRYIFKGNQTLKKEHPKVNLIIPLLFWFNRDTRLAFPNHIKPVGQIKVKIQLETADHLMTAIDVVNDVYNQDFEKPVIEECELYTRHIYFNADILDIFISKLGFNLIRIHKYLEKIIDTDNARISLQELKFPIDSMYVFFRPLSNENGIDDLETWYKNSFLNLNYIKTPIIYDNAGTDTLGINNIKYYDEEPVVTSLRFETNDVSTYDTQLSMFYDGYLPYISSDKIMSNQNNIYYMPFTLYPLENQPCGYLNLSKTREIYLEYSSEKIESHGHVKLYVYTTALNFLLITKNSAALKYIT